MKKEINFYYDQFALNEKSFEQIDQTGDTMQVWNLIRDGEGKWFLVAFRIFNYMLSVLHKPLWYETLSLQIYRLNEHSNNLLVIELLDMRTV